MRRVGLLVPASVLLAATCVTGTSQRGPAGPWVGEVVNYSNVPVNSTFVHARVFDADGYEFGQADIAVCPATLQPGERGTFEYFFDNFGGPERRLPLHAEFAAVPSLNNQPFPRYTGDGLTVREVQRDATLRFALIELKNNSTFTYDQVTVCGNLRTLAGDLAEVGNAVPLPEVLGPGDSRTFPLFFNSMPQGTIDFVARGVKTSGPLHRALDASAFHVTATEFVNDGTSRRLQVVGEWENAETVDFGTVQLAAQIANSPAYRADRVDAGCGGYAAAGSTVQTSFAIPLDGTSVGAKPIVVGLQAIEMSRKSPLFTVPSSHTALERLVIAGSGAARVTAVLENSTADPIAVVGACFNVRDRHGVLTGTTSSDFGLVARIPPGGSATVSQIVMPLGSFSAADVVAYGVISQPWPPTAP